jgi:hypothetical protein
MIRLLSLDLTSTPLLRRCYLRISTPEFSIPIGSPDDPPKADPVALTGLYEKLDLISWCQHRQEEMNKM